MPSMVTVMVGSEAQKLTTSVATLAVTQVETLAAIQVATALTLAANTQVHSTSA